MTTPLERYCFSLPTELCAEIRMLIKQHKIMRDALVRIQVRIDETNHHPMDLEAISKIAAEALLALDQRTDGQI